MVHKLIFAGPVVRIGPNALSFNTINALDAIHTNRRANVSRADWYKVIDAPSGEYSTQSVIDKKEHAFRRRVLSHAFSERAIRSAETFIQLNSDTLMTRLGENVQKDGWSEPKDFSIWATYFAFDFTGDLAFGSSFDMMNSEENRYVPTLLMGTSWFLYCVSCLWIGSKLNIVYDANMIVRLATSLGPLSFALSWPRQS
jgi:cytochrome P450